MTRQTAALAIVAALAAGACVWPGRAADGWAPLAYATDRDVGPAEPDGAAYQPIAERESAGESGNPIWAIPLSALSATRERPLFSASRRPPAPQDAPEPVASTAPKEAAPSPAADGPPPFALIGAIISPGATVALIRDSATQTIARLKVGDEAGGWRLQSVSPRSIVVEKGTDQATLEILRPTLGAGTKPAAGDGQPDAPKPPP